MGAFAAVHPTDQILQSYGLGKLDDASSEPVRKHLEGCDSCRQRVAEMSSDSFLGRLRGVQGRPDSPSPVVSSLAGLSMLDGSSGTKAPPPTSTLPLGLSEHPDYEIVRELGQGGMGTVYLAFNRLMGRHEVLKVVSSHLVKRSGVLDRFLGEIRNAARLHHTNIVTAYSAMRIGECLVFAMEYVEGLDLAKLVKAKGALPVANACNYVHQAALGLQHADELGMVHRDIKPSNLMLAKQGSRAVIKVLDFGLAKVKSEGAVDGGLTHEGQMLGTPDFIAPEQISDARRADIRADIYSLGCTLYYLLTGGPPFQATSLYEILQAHHSMDAMPLNLARPEVPVELAALVARMMAKEPERRFQTPRELAQSLLPFFKKGSVAFKGTKAELSQEVQTAAGRPESVADSTPTQRATDAGRPVVRASQMIGPAVPQARWEESLIEFREPQPSAELAPLGSPTPPRRPPWARYVVLAAAVPLFVVLAIGVVIKIRSRDGSETTINVPPGAKVIVEGNRREVEFQQPQGGGLTGNKDTGVKGQDGSPPSPAPVPVLDVGTQESQLLPPFTAGLERESPAGLRKKPSDLRASSALQALRRDRIRFQALAAAGGGDPDKAPASLVGVLGEAVPIHNQPVSSLAFSADGRWLASGSVDQTIILQQTTSGRVRRVLRGHTGALSPVVFSKDARTLVSASADGTVRFWPTQQDAEPEILQPNLGEIWAMAASVDGRYLAAGGTKGTIKLWKWGEWNTPVEIPASGGRVTTVALSPDGELLASGWDENKPEGPIRVYKTVDGKLAQTLPGHQKRVVALTFRPDGKALASVGDERYPKVWDLPSGKYAEFGRHNNWARCVAYTPDGKTLAVGVGWFLVLHGPLSRTARGLDPTFPKALAFSPDGKLLAVGADTGSVFVWDTTSWERQWLESGHPHRITALAVSPDGRTLLSGGDDFTLRRWNLERPGENELFKLDHLRFPRHGGDRVGTNVVAFSPDGQTFAAAAFGLFVWDAATGKARFTDSLLLLSLVYSPDGKTLAGCGEDGGVRLWDVRLGKEVHRFPPSGKCSGLAFTLDGERLAAASQDTCTVTVWNAVTGAELRSWKDSSMLAAAFSPDGKLLVTGHLDGTISLWNPADGEKKRILRGHTAPVRSLRFTPDGGTLVSAGDDGTIRLWNPDALRSREVIPVGPANGPLVIDVDYSGGYLVAAGHSPVIYLLRLHMGANAESLRGRVPTANEGRMAAQRVNLIELFDPGSGVLGGEWSKEDGIITCRDEWGCKAIEFPYAPPEEYDFRVKFIANAGYDALQQVCFTKGHRFLWTLSGRLNSVSGFGDIKGVAYESTATRVESKKWIVPGNSYSSLVKVRRDGVEAYLDGKLVSQWKTDFSDMSLPGYVRPRQKATLGLAFWGTRLTVEAAELIGVDRDEAAVTSESRPADDADRAMNKAVEPQAKEGARLPDRKASILSGSWRVEGIELVQDGGQGTILLGDMPLSSFDMRFQGQVVSGREGFVAFFHRTNGENVRFFHIGELGGKRVDLGFLCEGKEGGQSMPIATVKGRWYNVLVKVRSAEFWCYLDGQELFHDVDERFKQGRIGLATWDANARYRDIVITTPDGKVLWKGLPDLTRE
jgi:WD40 repeat protein/serine/threonine protein kinase